MESESRMIWAGVVVVAVLAGGAYYYRNSQNETPAVTPAETPVTEAPREPEIKYPIETPAPETPLPPLAESDAAVQQEMAALIDKAALKRFFEQDSIVRRVVVTIDNLPNPKIPQRYHLAKPVDGKFLVAGKEDQLKLNPENYRRYTPWVALAEKVDTQKLVAMYRRFYPLLQEEYRNIGSPKKYFNDRVVEAIDDLLAAPDPKGEIKLVRPRVFYEFADPALEDLSAGQKAMIRMGSENAARVKTKLREIRPEITR